MRAFTKVPFDLERWQAVAAEKYPNGLPEPFSDDPTQWIFHGHPCGSVVWDEGAKRLAIGPDRVDGTVLHIAVARFHTIASVAHCQPGSIQGLVHLMQGYFGCIVILAQVAQQHIFEMFAANAAHIFGCHHIVEVPFLATHAILEIFGIMPAVEHAAVIIALYHQVFGLAHVVVGTGCDDARVGSHHKLVSATLNHEAHVVRTVV